MFSGIVGLIGITPFFLLTLAFASFAAPAGLVLKRFKPILGAILAGLGLAYQVAYGVIVSLAMVSDTVWTYFLG